ncbi:MAG: hypothetical protein ACP5VN_00020 [Acidobacteriota bacterium]
MRRSPLFLATLFLVLGLSAAAQELSTFLSAPPPEGSWARYRIETTKEGGELKRRPFNLSVTGGEERGKRRYFRLEAGPTKFASDRDGILRLLLPAEPTPQEALNPFLAAEEVAYAPPKDPPYRLSEGALSFLHRQSRDLRVQRQEEPLGEETATATKGRSYPCRKVRITLTIEGSVLGSRFKTVETGIYWLSDETPFKVVRAEIARTETKKGKTTNRRIVVYLKESGGEGAKSAFPPGPVREKGLLGVLFP